MKIKGQTRKLAASCSKHSFEVVDEAMLTWFEEKYKLKLESLLNNKGEKTWLNTVLLEQGILELS